MKKINDFIKWFLYITTGVLIVCAVNFWAADMDAIPKNTLWQILLSGLLTAGVTVFIYPKDCNKKSVILTRIFFHYVVLCIVMIICGYWFGWLKLNAAGIVMMVVSVAVVYFLSFLAYYLTDLKRADEINRRLKEKYGD